MNRSLSATALIVFVMVCLSVWTQAQAPAQADPPSLAEADQLKIQVIELQAENLQLKLQQAATALTKLEAESQQFFKSLAKPGYTLERGPDGKWRYTAAKPDK